MITLFLKWIGFSVVMGITEGAFFAHGGSLTRWPYNIHKYLTIPRFYVGSMLVISELSYQGLEFWSGFGMYILIGLSFMCMFPLWHDGALYQTRHYLDFPAYNFFSHSDTTTANFSIDFVGRMWLFAGGMALYTLSVYILI